MKFLRTLGLLLLLAPAFGMAQQRSNKVKLMTDDGMETPRGGTKGGRTTAKYDKNLLSPRLITGRGIFGLTYQRMLTDYYGIEGTVGVTLYDIQFEGIWDEPGVGAGKPGPAVQAAVVLYPGGYDNFRNVYLRGLVGFRQTPGYTLIDLGVNHGRQMQVGKRKIVDVYYGLGVCNANYPTIEEKIENGELHFETVRRNTIFPRIYLGFSWGLPF
jgi:hypothetical protein